MSEQRPARRGDSSVQRGLRMALALLSMGVGWALVMAPVFGMVKSLPLVLGAFGIGGALLLVGTRAFKMGFSR